MQIKKSFNQIKDVTDTAIWVAVYRMEETNRPDGLFKDPLAQKLLSNEEIPIASYTQGSRYTAWSVVIRTYIIDQYIYRLLNSSDCKIDTIINIGAGLDTRPYRMILPKNLNWIEIDFENIIESKKIKLKDDIPKCQLQRVSLDLSNEFEFKNFLNQFTVNSQNTLILTEGVIPYLTNQEAQKLIDTIKEFTKIKFWITEYYSPEILEFLRTPKRLKQMEKAPFLFYPEDWIRFFTTSGWNEIETQYFGEVTEVLKRSAPIPGKNKKISQIELDKMKRYLGYTLYQARD